MKETFYYVAVIAVSIIRAVIGFAVLIPAVVICSVLDRFTAKLMINAGYDRDNLEGIREAAAVALGSMYRKLSNFS